LQLFQGSFPAANTMEDGYEGLSPVDAFPKQNKYGKYVYGTLVYFCLFVYIH